MKSIKYILLLALLPFNIYGQKVPETDSANYKAKYLSVYHKDTENHLKVNTILEFRDSVIHTTNDDQTRKFFVQDFKKKNIGGNTWVKKSICIDNAGKYCEVYTGYSESQDTTRTNYFVYLGYKNVEFFYHADTTSEEITNTIEDIPEYEMHEMFKEDYTKEEIDQVLSKFGDPELLRRMLIRHAWETM